MSRTSVSPRAPVHPPPPFLHRVPWDRFPDFDGTMRWSDFSPSIVPRLVAFALALPPPCLCFAPLARRHPVPGPDHFYCDARELHLAANRRRRPRDLPSSPADPGTYAPSPLDPAGSHAAGHHAAPNAAFRHNDDVGSGLKHYRGVDNAAHTRPVYAGLKHYRGVDNAAHTRPVYASQARSPEARATLGGGWWPTFTARDSHPSGPLQEVSNTSASYFGFIPLPGASWRTIVLSDRPSSLTPSPFAANRRMIHKWFEPFPRNEAELVTTKGDSPFNILMGYILFQ